jgi:hypothetical protein
LKGLEAEVPLSLRAINAIEEGCELDELAAGIHEIQVENLLSGHGREEGDSLGDRGLGTGKVTPS